MTNHLIWAAGLFGDLLILAVLFGRRRVAQFPWFTLLILFDFLRSISFTATLHFSGHPVPRIAALIIDLTDVLLQCAVLAELIWIGLRPLSGLRRLTLPLLLIASGAIIVLRLAPAGYRSLRMDLVLMHFLLSVLMLEWAIVLAMLLGSLRLSWRSHVAAISFGFGLYSAAQIAAGGYFTIGREMSDYVFFSLLRISIYLLMLFWWSLSLWLPEPGERSVPTKNEQ
jgi:hypothetical protein